MTMLILGSVLALATLWVGFYLMDRLPSWSWMVFPTVATMVAVFVAFACMAYHGAVQVFSRAAAP